MNHRRLSDDLPPGYVFEPADRPPVSGEPHRYQSGPYGGCRRCGAGSLQAHMEKQAISGEPRTEAGRGTLADPYFAPPLTPFYDQLKARILAIEAEASTGHMSTVEVWDKQKHRNCVCVHVDSDGNGYCERHSHWISTGAALDVPDALRKAWAFIGGITPDEWATIDKAREVQEHIDALARLAEQSDV